MKTPGHAGHAGGFLLRSGTCCLINRGSLGSGSQPGHALALSATLLFCARHSKARLELAYAIANFVRGRVTVTKNQAAPGWRVQAARGQRSG